MIQPRVRTLFDKIWEEHVVVAETEQTPAVLYVDLHLLHEVTSPQAFSVLAERKLRVRCAEKALATMDHSTPTLPRDPRGRFPIVDAQAAEQIALLERNCRSRGIALFALGDPRHGIIHVVAPELGYSQPGMTIVCGDSHTSTHGAFGALAFGIATSEVLHVLATQCLLQRKPKTLRARVEGRMPRGVGAKDLVLALIARIGIGGAIGHVIEFEGSTIRALSMEERMTVCNMSNEAGARAGLIAPDAVTFAYLASRPEAPRGEAWDRAIARWRTLPGDDGAAFDREIVLDASAMSPMITFGTDPASAIPIDAVVPDPRGDATKEKALGYMGLAAGKPLLGHPIDVVFVGSCTNARIEDLRLAAGVLDARKVARGVRMLVVPGSQSVKAEAEAEGLHRIFEDAGAEWREPGCSMCIAMNGDHLLPGQYAVSTSNRNSEGRQGKGGRTFLASPLTAAAAAVTGRITDVRELMR